MPTVRVVTINILNDLSRWAERGLLLADGLAELQPDLIALQEVKLPENTAQWLADQLNNRRGDRSARLYSVHLCPRTGMKAGKEGIAILSRLPVEREDWLDLRDQNRVAQYVWVRVEGRPLILVNGHYYWMPGEAAGRDRQVERLLEWLGTLPHEAALVVCGDFNGTPKSRAIRRMRRRFASAYAARHGREPEYTAPTPLQRLSPARAAIGFALNLIANHSLRPWRGTLDYVFVNACVRVVDCQAVLNGPAPHDPTLYPSDHFGLAATLGLISQ